MRWVRAFLVLVLFAGLVRAAPALAGNNTPRFEAGGCPFRIGQGLTQGKEVRCGYLVVPEDRGAPSGPTVRLAVAIFKAPGANRAPDPIIFLSGGPGGALVAPLGGYINASNVSILTGSHDLILLDQRGTGSSQPSLACPEVIALQYQILSQDLSVGRQETLEATAVRQCHDRLVHRGVNLNAYTSLADAADVADLRTALGYDQVNLYGVSYGTRLALTVMRAFPTGIRSVVLDSPVPPSENFFSHVPAVMAHAFRVLFAGCARDQDCNRDYPHLLRTFDRLVARLNAKPITVEARDQGTNRTYSVVVNGFELAGLIFTAQYDTPLIPLLPKLIWSVQHGKDSLLSKIVGDVGFPQADINEGMMLSVVCGEDAPFATEQQIAAAARALPRSLQADVRTFSAGELHLCNVWNVGSASPTVRQPVDSSIPTLVLDGQYDPILPPNRGALIARTLSRSYRFVFPGVGHGVRFAGPCPNDITRDFFDRPTQKPDAGCIANMSSPQFVLKDQSGS